MARDDEKHSKFLEIAERRTNNALEEIRKIGNLSNRQLYSWDEGEIKAIFKALKNEIAEVEARFASPDLRGKSRFKF